MLNILMLGNCLYVLPLDCSPTPTLVTTLVESFIVSCDDIISHKMWSSEERNMSSTWREMKAIYYSLLSFLPLLKGQNIHWFSDNQGTISVINYRSMKVHLQKLALDIFSLCLNNNISIYLEWIPRNLDEIADAISKL